MNQMDPIIQDHIQKALMEFTSGEHYQTLVEARNEYFSITGQVNEDDKNFEARMNSFNDWYMLHFVPKNRDNAQIIIKEYLLKNNIDQVISDSFLNVNFSLFEYRGISWKGFPVLKDYLHDKKILLPKEHPQPAVLEGEIFTGRVISYDGQHYLLSGLCVLPKEIRWRLKSQSRKIRKLKDAAREAEFLLKIEALATKWSRYGHIDPRKIFVFE
jgi:hypothetical protein